MPTVTEALTGRNQLAGSLAIGVDTLSFNQTVTFTKYIKLILPLDGFVFWVRADLLSASALFNASAFNAAYFNEPSSVVTPATQVQVKGSVHIITDGDQLEDEVIAVHRMIFTAEAPILAFAEISPTVLFLGEMASVPEGVPFRFSFSRRDAFYQQAGLNHYVGNAVYPALESQIVDRVDGLDTVNVVVSNSLPVWLSIDTANPVFPASLGAWPATQKVPLYPSFLVPDNLRPPYGVIHILPEGTRAIQSLPYLSSTLSHSQLAADRVRVTLYGLRNFNAQDWVDYVLWYSQITDNIGIMNMPILRDEKRTQTELAVLAQKKTIEFEVSYYQNRMRDVARQLIQQAIPAFIPSDKPLIKTAPPIIQTTP